MPGTLLGAGDAEKQRGPAPGAQGLVPWGCLSETEAEVNTGTRAQMRDDTDWRPEGRAHRVDKNGEGCFRHNDPHTTDDRNGWGVWGT